MCASPLPSTIDPSETPLSPTKKIRTETIVLSSLLFVVIVIAFVVLIFFDQIAAYPMVQKWFNTIPPAFLQKIDAPKTLPSPSPKPTPSYLPPGKQTYSVGQNATDGLPNIVTLTLDPIDIKSGDQQSIDVTVDSSSLVQSVNLTLYADDNQKQTIALTQDASTKSSAIWRGTWTVKYSVWYRYVIMITATNDAGENKAYVALRTDGPIKKSDLD